VSRIVKAEVFLVPYTLPGYKLSFGTLTKIVAVLLKLTDSDGFVGWGEANALQPFTDENPAEVAQVLEHELLPVVLTQLDAQPEHIDQLLDDIRPGQHLLAKGAVSMALLDARGRRLGVPVADLLGGAIRRSLQVSHPLNNGTFEDDIAVIDAKMADGYIDFMLKMGTSPIPDEIKRVIALEERYGDSVRFKADPNAGWSREQAQEFLDGVKHSNLAFVEQPVAKDDIDGMAVLVRGTTLPISADESLTGLDKALLIVAKGAATVFSIKSSKNGGPLRAKALSDLAREHGIDCYFNSMIEGGITQAASLHHALTTPNILDIGHSYRSTLRLDGDVTNFASYVRDGIVHMPKGSGLGIEVDEERVRRTALN
jgi:muconate cycloisomerase